MKFCSKKILVCLSVLLLFSIVNAQENRNLQISALADDEGVCGLISSPLILVNVSVWSNRMAYLKNLTYKDFEVYDENELQEIDFFKFDELSNQYIIGFYQKDFMPDDKRRDVKIKVKLSKEKADDFGEITVTQSEYGPNQN